MFSHNTIGIPFIELLKVESTNNYAMGMVHEGMAHHGTAVFAHHQFKGKGQRTKTWESEPGKNLALSIVIEPQKIPLLQAFRLSMAIATATRKCLSTYLNEDVKIKWPNDIYFNDRKTGGILIENVLQGLEWKYAVCGIGLNVNQTDFGSLGVAAISIKQATGKEYVPLSIAHLLCTTLQDYYERLLKDPASIISEYSTHLYKIGEKVKLKQNTRVFEATIKGVTDKGQLITWHAIEEIFNVGEIEWLPKSTEHNQNK